MAMESLTSQSSIKLVIKTPNQRVKDIEVSCLLDWTVEKLKHHLSTVYPTKPARSSQKIIYSGKLLHDHFVLKDVLQESEGRHQTVHLVCTPLTTDTSNSQQTASIPNAASSTSAQVTPSPSLTTTAGQDRAPDSGLRQRNHLYAQHPYYNMQHGHPPHFPYTAQGNGDFPLPGQMAPPFFSNVNQNGVNFRAQNIYIAAQHMAHMQWMHHMAQVMQANGHNWHHGSPVVPPQNIVNAQQNVEQQVPPVAQPAAAVPQAPRAQQRQENAAQNRNMVMNANAGGGMMQQDNEDDGQRDWLDYVYMVVRIFMLMSIFWFYSSPEKLIVMGLIVFIAWLLQSGAFNLNRAQRNRQQEVPVDPVNQEGEEELPENEEGTEEDDGIEGDSEGESEDQDEDETDSPANNNISHPGYFVVAYNFVVTFFTSLIPQAPGAIAQP